MQVDKKAYAKGERMHKVSIVLLCIMVVAVFGIASGMAGNEVVSSDEETMCIPMGVLSLAPPEEVDAKRTAVDFPHATHFDFSCMECHHQWSAEEPIQSCGTSGCHDLNTQPKPDSGDEPIMYYKKAYHQMCLGCHREMKALNKKVAMTLKGSETRVKSTGPTGCIQCHPK